MNTREDDRLRELLQDIASEMPVNSRLPAATRRRARGRRALAAALTAVLVTTLAGGALIGARAVLGARDGIPADGATGLLRAPIWPQGTVEEARAAQAAADSGHPAYEWQLDARVLADRYARQVLGWDTVFFERDLAAVLDQYGSEQRGPRSLLVSDCPLPTPPGCSAPVTALLSVEQLFRQSPSGLWFLTDARVTDYGRLSMLSTDRATHVVSSFLQLRILGSPEAWGYLTEVAHNAYAAAEGGLSIHGTSSDPYTGFDIYAGPTVVGEGFAAYVALRARSGEQHFELLRLEAGLDRLYVTSAEAIADPASAPETLVETFVAIFMDSRLQGLGAEEALSQEALSDYASGVGGLALYLPLEGYKIELVDPERPGSFRVIVRLIMGSTGGGDVFEVLTVDLGAGGEPVITAAEVIEGV